MSVGESHFRFGYALNLFEVMFRSPEATTCEIDVFCGLRFVICYFHNYTVLYYFLSGLKDVIPSNHHQLFAVIVIHNNGNLHVWHQGLYLTSELTGKGSIIVDGNIGDDID